MTTTSETWGLLTSLFVVPLSLLLGLRGRRRLPAKPADTGASAPAAAPETPPPVSPPRPPVLAILAASLRLPHGASAAALAKALADGRVRAEPDPELVDGDGNPIAAARSEGACDEALRDAILAWLAANGLAELYYNDEQWRALILATQVTAELAGEALRLLTPAAGPAWLPRPLRLVPLLPADWNSAQRRAAGQWLEHTVTQAGWPASAIERTRSTLPGPDEFSPAAPFGHLAHEAVLSNAPLSALVVACASHVGGATVARWAADGKLFTPAQPHGSIPGEGAAGLLLLDERQARAAGGAAMVRLDALQEARRASACDASRPVDAQLLTDVIARALDHAGATVDEVAMVVADTGERTRRVLELMASVAALSRLHPAHDIARLGIACGNCGVVSFIAALALARHHALERRARVLCVSNEDPCRRIAAVVGP